MVGDRLGGEDPGAGVGRTPAIVTVDQDRAQARAGELVGGGGPDEPTADDGRVEPGGYGWAALLVAVSVGTVRIIETLPAVRD